MKELTSLPAADLAGRRVLIRADLNVPLADGKITSAARIDAALDAVHFCKEAGAKVMLMSHLGRPPEGYYDKRFSLAPVADALREKLDCQVALHRDYLQTPPAVQDGEVAVLENVRFNRGEGANDADLAKQYAALCDVFVMDAFASAHRAHASTCGVAEYAPIACAGPLLQRELTALDKAMENPERPLIAIVGGGKIAGKLQLLDALTARVDVLIPGGGIANTLLAAAGYDIGASLHEPALIPAARALLATAKARGCGLPLPYHVIAIDHREYLDESFDRSTGKVPARTLYLPQLERDEMIMDIALDTTWHYVQMIAEAGTILWNGPVGVFEHPAFSAGSESVGRAVAYATDAGVYTIAGGGDTLAAIEQFGLGDRVSYISTGGGAFLAYLQGGELPAVAALHR